MRTTIDVRCARTTSTLIIVAVLLAIGIAACSSSGASPILSTAAGPSVMATTCYGEAGPSAAASAASAPRRRRRHARQGGDAVGAVDDAKIIRTGSIELEVRTCRAPSRAARDAIRGLGGYVGASNTSNDGDQPSPRSPTGSRPTAGRTPSTACAA